MANPVVIVNVSQQQAPLPNNLQKQGAFLSQGGTILGAQNYSYLSQFSDLTALLSAALAITSIAWASTFGGQATVTTAAAHGVAINEQFITTIAGAVPAGYNGMVLATATGTSTFTYQLLTNPGTTPATTPGTFTPRGVGDLVAMATTFFAQGGQQGVWVLELGAGEPNAGVTALSAFIANSAQFFYAYMPPRNWDGNASFLTFLAGFEATTSKTYFLVTTSLQNYSLYTSLMKCVLALVESEPTGVWVQNALSAATYSSPSITATTTNPHGVIPGQYFTILGASPAGYNGTFIALPGTTGSTLVYAPLAAVGTISIEGTLQASLYANAGVPASEYSIAAVFQTFLNFAPSSTNQVTSLAYAELTGVTPFPTRGNQALLATLGTANINYVGTASEGGLTNAILFSGHTKDGKPFKYWYATDWMQINVDLNIANAIFNGNNPINPLNYNQLGINRLQAVAAATGRTAISVGLALGTVNQVGLDGPTFVANLNNGAYAGNLVVNAIPFVPYSIVNPNDYAQGLYSGMSMVFTPLQGFEKIIFNILVSQFVASA